MALLFVLFTTLIVAAILSPLFTTLKNYSIARKIGFPVIFTPVSLTNPVWALWGEKLGPLLKRLPFGLGNWTDLCGFTPLFHQKYRLHEKLGPAYIRVTPGDIQIILADASAADDLLSRRKDFIKPPVLYQPLDLFGPNVDTLNGEGWARHRRLTTPPFNERNSSNVWRQSLAQASDMLNSWIKIGREGVSKTKIDTETLALHVLIAAGFGKTYDFGGGGVTKPPPGHILSYRDSLKVVLGNLFTTIIMSSLTLPNILLTRNLIHAKDCIKEFRQYLVEMVEEERQSLHQREEEKDNLLSVLVRISEAGATGRQGLSNEEIYGNLFIYTLAGHDTTANTLAYTIVLLSAYPRLQLWIREEINSVFGENEDVEDWEYEKAFPRLKRCLALMYETLRLYGPVLMVPKHTGDSPTTLSIQGKTYKLPPNVFTVTNILAISTLPSSWGPDSLTWKPERWIINSSPVANIETEEMFQPALGSFIPWASGPRICPGKKFAQVEFVAVLARLFRRHQVKPVLEEGETVEEANVRILAVAEDSYLNITLQMRHPEKAKLAWEEVA